MLLVATLQACLSSSSFTIVSEIRMHSELGNGLYILDSSLRTSRKFYTDTGIIRQWPRIRGDWNHGVYGFKDRSKDYPDTVSFKFQYQTMSDCPQGSIIKSRGVVYDPVTGYPIKLQKGPYYIHNSDCKTFTPTGEVFTRAINLREVLAGDKNIGLHNKKIEGSWNDHHIAKLVFEFYDGGIIKVHTSKIRTNNTIL